MVSYRHADGGVTVDLRDANALQGQPDEADLISEVEDVEGSEFDDKIYGDDFNNVLWGWGGNDQIHGFAGFDIITGGFGTDFLVPSYNPDGVQDLVDCDDYGSHPRDGDNGDHGVRFAVDNDFVRDCENILDL